MKVLVVGSAGREQSIVWKFLRSSGVDQIFVAPGNGGTALMGERVLNVAIKPAQIDRLVDFAKNNRIGLTVVGPEDPLVVGGIVDKFTKAGLVIFGPTQKAAEITEGSKVAARMMMRELGVPSPDFTVYSDAKIARAAVRQHFASNPNVPVVLKADGLCGGKGVFVCRTLDAALQAIAQLMVDREFGPAGDIVLYEEFLKGCELSIMALCDGREIRLLLPSQDHKQEFDGDKGRNTGGMGAFAPVGWVTNEMLYDIIVKIFKPVIDHLRIDLQTPYRGVLYAGLMYTSEGFKVLEFNCRFGDPETQVVLPLLKDDLLPYLLACTDGTLRRMPQFTWWPGSAVCTVMTSKGYPGQYETGYPISGLEAAEAIPGCHVFHAGTAIEGGQIVTAGGRVLNVVGSGANLQEAIKASYAAVAEISFEGKTYRTDIGSRPWPSFAATEEA